MDYDFTSIEIMEIYSRYNKLIVECEMLKQAGVKVNSKEVSLYNSIAAKLLAKYPKLANLNL